MQNKLPKNEYLMAAVIGLNSKNIEDICMEIRKQNKFVVPSNYNYQNQTVISGEKEAVEEACEILKNKGAKKVVLLKTSGPFHTSELEEAKEDDVNFELLNDVSIDKIFCIGRFRYDVKTRLEYAGIDKNKLVLVDDLNNLLNLVEEKSTGDIYTMVCFDMTAIIKKMIEEQEK